ncbi:MAG: DUF479 domain-containing protein [Gemmataceae bacterium]|nr:DUF479 domain-containing protein [Gemmataceae bacterium]
MNWLAHVYLAESDIEARLGNLLADLVKGPDRRTMTASFTRGMRLHQAIDIFTDAHPVVHRSRARIYGDYRHFTGILVDVFYDHYLALDWDRYAAEPLDAFTARLYADIRAHPITLPADAQAAFNRMLEDDRLGSYRQIDGIAAALQRVSMRLAARTGKEFALEKAVSELLANFDALRNDFAEFFPALREHVERWKIGEPQCGPCH